MASVTIALLAAKARGVGAVTWMQMAMASATIKAQERAVKGTVKAVCAVIMWMRTVMVSAIIKVLANSIAVKATDKVEVKDADKAIGENQAKPKYLLAGAGGRNHCGRQRLLID